MGPIRFDFSQILQSESYDRTETFRFSTSTQF
jgi:outer membrane protein insertion porin family